MAGPQLGARPLVGHTRDFAPEIRRALERIGRAGNLIPAFGKITETDIRTIRPRRGYRSRPTFSPTAWRVDHFAKT